MPIYNVHLTTPLHRSFRTEQVAGLFDLALDNLAEERLAHTLTAELPGLDEDWTIGAIIGPSGSGKTTLARAAYGAAVYEPRDWPEEVAIIDALDLVSKAPTSGRGVEPFNFRSRLTIDDGKHRSPNTLTNGRGFESAHLPLKHLLRVLTAVGLASPPSWLKPYRVLSTGERFRADLARALIGARGSGLGAEGDQLADRQEPNETTPLSPEPRTPSPSLLVFDEFTSTLDRTVACTASFALSKYLRSGVSNPKSKILNPKFIALSCHTDFLSWLAPDWILDFTNHQGQVTSDQGLLRPTWPRGSLQRPPLRLHVRRVPQKLWPHFARHHYLSGGLSTAATCYAAFPDAVQCSKFKVARTSRL
jgi:hypothetical protein